MTPEQRAEQALVYMWPDITGQPPDQLDLDMIHSCGVVTTLATEIKIANKEERVACAKMLIDYIDNTTGPYDHADFEFVSRAMLNREEGSDK